MEGQLTIASYRAEDPAGTAWPARRRDIFQYDELGNREGSNYLANRGTLAFPRRDNGLNQYAGWMPYSPISYDDPALPARGNGVLAENGWISATYNALNQPMGMWSSAYGSTNNLWFGYDPLGRCVKRWVGPDNQPPANTNPATYYYYEGWNLIQEGPSGAAAERTYVHGGRVDEIVASQAGGVWNYHQYDARGHCTLLTDTSGGIREQYDYDAFGWPYHYNAAGIKLSASGQWGNRFLFTGREWLRDLRVYDYRNRMYHPELGRFLQPDPQHFEAGDYNLYRYCRNDPINKTDPDGLYGRGDNWKNEDWKKFDKAQQAAASRLERASAKMDAKAFEKAFGKGSATAENMAKVQKTMQGMAAALRDDGSKGYFAHSVSAAEVARQNFNPVTTLGIGTIGGKEIQVNRDHRSSGSYSALRWMAGHESGHNMGMGHGVLNGETAYKYGNPAQREAYKNLPTADRLGNPDNYIDFAR